MWHLSKQRHGTCIDYINRDILTELNYPASGLEAIHMPLPVVRGNPACLDERTMEYYYMRLLLHRQLHEIFVLVYSDSGRWRRPLGGAAYKLIIS